MCLPIDSCFGFGAPRTDDDHYHAPASRPQQPQGQQRNGSHYNNGNTNGAHYNGNGYTAHNHRAAEAASKASNEARRDPAHVVPAGGWHGHGHAATGAQEKMVAYYPYAGADGALKQQPAAPNGRVVAADGHGARGGAPHNYYERAQLAAHKEDAADSYYPAATATADHESPSEALAEE